MGASCARLCAGEGDEWQIPSDGTSSPGVQMGDLNSQPFLTLKSRDPEALEKTLVAADALLAACDWVLKAPLPERYVVGKALGKGATGIVMRATRRSDGLLCAIKSVPKVRLNRTAECAHCALQSVIRNRFSRKWWWNLTALLFCGVHSCFRCRFPALTLY